MSKRTANKLKNEPKKFKESDELTGQTTSDDRSQNQSITQPKTEVVSSSQNSDEEAFRMAARQSSVVLGRVTEHNIQTLKTLFDTIFSIEFKMENYKDVDALGELARIAFCDGVPVGAVICDTEENDTLYISLIGVLKQYQKCGIGAVLLQYAIQLAEKLDRDMSLHVEVDNVNAKTFYKKNGFIMAKYVKDYYEHEPKAAFLFVKINHKKGKTSSVGAGGEPPGTSAQSNPIPIHEATKENLSDLQMVVKHVFPEVMIDVNLNENQEQREFFRLAYVNNEAAGFIIVRKEYETLYIALIGVLAEHRRKGVGSALIHHAVSLGKSLKMDIELHVEVGNAIAQQFCQQLGFVETEDESDVEPRNAYIYRKKLND